MDAVERASDWIVENKLRAVLYTWAGGITGALAYQWSKPGAFSVKLIHSRVYAQAITIGALGAVAGLELYKQRQQEQEAAAAAAAPAAQA